MSATLSTPKTTSGGEIITHLINSTDGAGLHFDGTSGNIDIATVPDLGTKFSFEFVIQATTFGSAQVNLIDFGAANRFVIYSHPTTSELTVISGSSSDSFGVAVLDDLKVHHLVFTVDGTSGILYDNGSQVGEVTITVPTLDLATAARIGTKYDESGSFFNGTLFRTRFWNKTLSQTDVTSVYESASLDFADQWGSQTELSSNTDFSGTWSGGVASGYTNTGGTPTEESTIVYGSNTRSQKVALTSTKLDLRVPNATSVAGQNYRFTAFVRSSVGVTIALHDYNGASTANFKTQAIVADTWTEVSGFTIPTNTTRQFQVKTTGAVTADIYVGQISVVASGCVSDYDLAYANPTQSDIVRNRNDTVTADGTAAGGVKQITKIEAVNTNKLSVGGTTPRVGIGLAAGVAPDTPLHVAGTTTSGVLKLDSTAASSLAITTTAANTWEFSNAGNNSVYNAYSHTFKNAATSTGLTINNLGNVSCAAGLAVTGAVTATTLSTFSAGIAFQSATTGTGTGTEYTLDAYEEGTWTPVIEGGTSAGTYTTVYAFATYTKIGRVVTVNFVLDWNSHDGTGDLIVTGLPFTCLSNTANIGAFQCNSGLSWTAGTVPALYATGTSIYYRCAAEGGGAFSTMQIAAVGGYLRGTLTYFV